MKKTWLCCLLALAMVACGEPNTGDENLGGDEGNQTEQPEEKPTPEPEPEPTPEPEPEPEPELAPAPNISKEVPPCSIKEFTNWKKCFDSSDVIGDFSGVCFNADKSGLIGVSNSGGTLWNINFDGTRESTHFVKLEKDLEGVTVDPVSGTIYVCEEKENYVWRVFTEDGKWKARKVAQINANAYDSNSGLEAITYHDGYLYIGNQSPANLVIYSLEHEAVALMYHATFITECFSDLWFDTTNNTLWAVDAWSDNKEIVNFTIWGDFIARFKSNVPWIEGICLDFENNKAWFACDSTGQLYSADIVRSEAAE